MLFGGEYEITGNVHTDDFIEFMITDEDNVLGYGQGFVVDKFLETEKIMPGQYSIIFPYNKKIKVEGAAAKIPPFLYLTTRYKSYGSSENDIKLIVRLAPWR